MPFGEMTITLDDVACLLHLPVRGRLFTPRSFTMEEAAALAAELLGVTYESALEETAQQRGGYFSQQWLYQPQMFLSVPTMPTFSNSLEISVIASLETKLLKLLKNGLLCRCSV
jgi:hypothetical protein